MTCNVNNKCENKTTRKMGADYIFGIMWGKSFFGNIIQKIKIYFSIFLRILRILVTIKKYISS